MNRTEYNNFYFFFFLALFFFGPKPLDCSYLSGLGVSGSDQKDRGLLFGIPALFTSLFNLAEPKLQIWLRVNAWATTLGMTDHGGLVSDRPQ